MNKTFFNADIKKGSGPDMYRAVANTGGIDRDREIILPSGVENLSKWLSENPVIFYGHSWMAWEAPKEEMLPIGRAERAAIVDDHIEIEWWFHDGEFAQSVKTLVDQQILNATSIGFIGKEWVTNPDDMIAVMKDEGLIETVDDVKLPTAICTKWELLELSVVSIPSNSEAEILRSYAPEGAVANAVKCLCDFPQGAKMFENARTEGPEAEATPVRRRTFAENYRGRYHG